MREVILSLDVSSTNTGYCILKNGRFTKTKKDYGTISPSKNKTLGEKLSFFRDAVEELIDKYKPTHIVVEDVFVGHRSTIIILSRFSGVVIEVCSRNGFEPALINATKARSILGVQNKKEEAFKYIVGRYKLDWDFKHFNDVTDSILLALAFRKQRSDEQSGRKVESPTGVKKISGKKSTKSRCKK